MSSDKLFKRVVPGQFEKFFELFGEFYFLKSFSYVTGKEVIESITVGAVFRSENGLSMLAELNVVGRSNTYELSKVIFSDVDNPVKYFLYSEIDHRYKYKNVKLRKLIDGIIPSYKRIDGDNCLCHLDFKCIEYIHDMFFCGFDPMDEIVDAVIQAKNRGMSLKGMDFVFNEIEEADRLIEVEQVLMS